MSEKETNMSEKKKKVIQRQVVIGYKFTIAEVDSKGKMHALEEIIQESPNFANATMKSVKKRLAKEDAILYALPEGKVTEMYEMDLDFFMENARKIETATTESEEK